MTRKYFSLFLLGFYSLVTQLLLIREALSAFSSNEITAGVFLAAWLLGAAFGNGLSQRFAERLKEFSLLLFFINLNFFLLIILVFRHTPYIFSFSPGETVHYFYFFFMALVLVLPFSLGWGINFNYLYLALPGEDRSAGRAYFWESLGAALASLLSTFLLLRFFPVFLILAFLFGLLCLALYLAGQTRSFVFFASAVIMLLLLLFYQKLDYFSEMNRLPGRNIVRIRESPYGRLLMTEYRKVLSLYQNNTLLFASDEKLLSEIMVSLLAAQTEKKERVLLLENGFSGILEQLLLYPDVREIHYVEHNRDLLNVFLNHLPASFLKDDRVSVRIDDARRFLMGVRDPYDAVILNTPEPTDLQFNRFFTREFFRCARRAMGKRSVLIFRVSSSENFLNAFQSMYLGSLYNTLRSVFEDVILLPGEECFFLASPSKGILTYGKEDVEQRSEKTHSEFFRRYYVPLVFSEYRIRNFLNSIDLSARMNADLLPIAFFYHTVLWATRVSESVKQMLLFFYRIPFAVYLGLVLCAGVILHAAGFRKKKNVIFASLAAAGFSIISLEIMVLFLYQILKGSLYHNAGLIFFSAMLGFSAGSIASSRLKVSRLRLFLAVQLLLVLFPLSLLALFPLLGLLAGSRLADALLILFNLLVSASGGLLLPSAAALFPEDPYSPGRINRIDLSAGALGAFFVSSFFIPLYGIGNTVLFLSFVNFTVFSLMLLRLLKPA